MDLDKLKFREEITVWDKAPNTPNHIYVFDNKVLVGYVKRGTTKIVWMKPSRQWSARGRKFRYLNPLEIAMLEA